ncbi:MAG: hypothetical protein ACQESN_09905, partial [Thermotogota bacterium]
MNIKIIKRYIINTNNIIDCFLINLVKREDIRGTLGLSNSLESLSRIFALLAGGLFTNVSGSYLPSLLGGVIVLLSLMIYTYYVIINKNKIVYVEK